jgi:NAD(P)-dependent dehydrogenase (short-subunit alcohol dehydrogenase family)
MRNAQSTCESMAQYISPSSARAMHRRGRELLGNAIYDNILSQRVHARRAGRPEEIAGSIVFLCPDGASYITGTTLTPDGGFPLTI